MRRDLVNLKLKSSFQSVEKDIELILRKLFIENKPLSDELKKLLIINTKDCLFIYCKPTEFNIGQKEEMDGVIENQRILNKQWEKVIHKFQYNYGFVYKYDYQSDSEAERLLDVIQMLQEF